MTEPNMPPTTEIITSWSAETDWWIPIAVAMTLASSASSTDITAVRLKDAIRFWPSTESARNETRNAPVWIAVDRRLPSVENTLPRRPIAAGTKMSIGVIVRQVESNPTSIAPAAKLVVELKNSATKLWRAAPPVGPSRSTRRRRRRSGRRPPTSGRGDAMVPRRPYRADGLRPGCRAG